MTRPVLVVVFDIEDREERSEEGVAQSNRGGHGLPRVRVCLVLRDYIQVAINSIFVVIGFHRKVDHGNSESSVSDLQHEVFWEGNLYTLRSFPEALHVFATVFCASILILCRSVPTFQRIVQLLECSVWNCDEGVGYLRLNNEILATNHLRAPAERQRVARQIPPVNAFTGVETGQARPHV
eukprot:CAMPEP_0185617622 /NCGR_PEP_ID=MMETSP0436-20130131/44219_1 /TAXON_ID=626734 ORGANISM="Favella taraikaensis, Strain Fe Narragansett Bay" /NCGR_SAMPLE_ID=MMETSP0436 /ASSEMBLY_ACC=CAM_ASM_000390 /LENGTH=180 /DNA_ID=CAMNT_0028255461 /DNA_START=74 /DNA_END=613 /DNA_ORIENTATION=-